MSQDFQEGHLTFSFPDGWLICRPERTKYYSGPFQGFCGGCKEMDFLAYGRTERILWLIEVKDYRINTRTKQQALADEIAFKVRDSLALLMAGKVIDKTFSDPEFLEIGDFARQMKDFKELRIVLHCELPKKPSKLFPMIKDEVNLSTKLRQTLRCIDPHAIFMNRQTGHMMSWSVQ